MILYEDLPEWCRLEFNKDVVNQIKDAQQLADNRITEIAEADEFNIAKEMGTIDKGIGTTLNMNGEFTLRALRVILQTLESIAKD